MHALNFAISSNVSDSKDLSEQSLNLVNLYLSTKRKLTHLDKELKHRFYFYVFFLISFCSLFFLFCFLNTQLKINNFILLPLIYIYILLNKYLKNLLYEHNHLFEFILLTWSDFINSINFIDFIDYLHLYENKSNY